VRDLYRILSLLGDVKAARRGPGAYGRRYIRKQANRHGNRWLRRLLKP
jgi:hypothetical protein